MAIIPEGWNLFIVDLEYIAPMSKVEPVLEPHLAFVRQAYDEGRYLVSGPKQPRTGGVIVMMAPSLAEAKEYNAADPFVTEGVAQYTYTEFLPNNRHEALK